MLSRRFTAVLACALLACVCCSSLSVAARGGRAHSAAAPASRHVRPHHIQGESLAKPEDMLNGVDMDRFMHDFAAAAESKLHTRKSSGVAGQYSVGAGIYDVTGQIAEIGFMGYAVPNQKGAGIQLRLRSRAFVFVDSNPGSTGQRVVYVSIDLCMGFQMVKLGVIERLQAKFGPDVYTRANVLISGTHTHATPGGLGGTVLVDLTTLGFIPENYEAAVEGIFQSIVQAHNAVVPAVVKMAIGQCDGCNINRSPSAYLLDPDAGQYANNTDHDMTVLRIEDATTGAELGMINFFAVHGTSLNNTNTLVSGDNKGSVANSRTLVSQCSLFLRGWSFELILIHLSLVFFLLLCGYVSLAPRYAGVVFEAMKNPAGTLPGVGPFIAAFGQSNLGDVSPNTRGPHCPDGTPCNFNHSTCGGLTETCIATGPGDNQYQSMEIIGQMQVDAAMALYESATEELTNEGVNYRYQFFDMQNITVSAEFTSTGQPGQTCQAAMGYSFAAGTTDGPGDFNFTQGTTSGNPFWNFVSGLLAKPTPEQIACQAPKPILLAVGDIHPIEWVPYILPEQVFRIGNLWILAGQSPLIAAC